MEVLCDVCGEECEAIEGVDDRTLKPGLWVRYGCEHCPESACSADHYEEHMGREHDTDVVWDEAA